MPKKLHHKLQSRHNTGISARGSFDFASPVHLSIFISEEFLSKTNALLNQYLLHTASCQHTHQCGQSSTSTTDICPWSRDRHVCQVQPLLAGARAQFLNKSLSSKLCSLKWRKNPQQVSSEIQHAKCQQNQLILPKFWTNENAADYIMLCAGRVEDWQHPQLWHEKWRKVILSTLQVCINQLLIRRQRDSTVLQL